LQQAQPFVQSAATRHIQIEKGTIGTDQELKTSSTQIGETSIETATHLSYRSMNKAVLYQKKTQSSACGSINISIHHATKPRGSKRAYASSSTTRIENGR
jgi:hypothetical protein